MTRSLQLFVLNSLLLFSVSLPFFVSLFSQNLFSFQHAKVTFDSIIATTDPQYANFTAIITKRSRYESSINVTINYAYVVSKMTVLFTLAIPKDRNDKNYERIVINSNVNICRMMQGITGDFMTKTIMEELHKCVDFEMSCPLPKVGQDISFENPKNLDKFLILGKPPHP
jgi:hypothetical protein